MSENEKNMTITVRSRGERFRRAGIDFTRAGVVLDPAALTEEQRHAIAHEPALIVELSVEGITDEERAQLAAANAQEGGAKVVVTAAAAPAPTPAAQPASTPTPAAPPAASEKAKTDHATAPAKKGAK